MVSEKVVLPAHALKQREERKGQKGKVRYAHIHANCLVSIPRDLWIKARMSRFKQLKPRAPMDKIKIDMGLDAMMFASEDIQNGLNAARSKPTYTKAPSPCEQNCATCSMGDHRLCKTWAKNIVPITLSHHKKCPCEGLGYKFIEEKCGDLVVLPKSQKAIRGLLWAFAGHARLIETEVLLVWDTNKRKWRLDAPLNAAQHPPVAPTQGQGSAAESGPPSALDVDTPVIQDVTAMASVSDESGGQWSPPCSPSTASANGSAQSSPPRHAQQVNTHGPTGNFVLGSVAPKPVKVQAADVDAGGSILEDFVSGEKLAMSEHTFSYGVESNYSVDDVASDSTDSIHFGDQFLVEDKDLAAEERKTPHFQNGTLQHSYLQVIDGGLSLAVKRFEAPTYLLPGMSLAAQPFQKPWGASAMMAAEPFRKPCAASAMMDDQPAVMQPNVGIGLEEIRMTDDELAAAAAAAAAVFSRSEVDSLLPLTDDDPMGLHASDLPSTDFSGCLFAQSYPPLQQPSSSVVQSMFMKRMQGFVRGVFGGTIALCIPSRPASQLPCFSVDIMQILTVSDLADALWGHLDTSNAFDVSAFVVSVCEKGIECSPSEYLRGGAVYTYELALTGRDGSLCAEESKLERKEDRGDGSGSGGPPGSSPKGSDGSGPLGKRKEPTRSPSTPPGSSSTKHHKRQCLLLLQILIACMRARQQRAIRQRHPRRQLALLPPVGRRDAADAPSAVQASEEKSDRPLSGSSGEDSSPPYAPIPAVARQGSQEQSHRSHSGYVTIAQTQEEQSNQSRSDYHVVGTAARAQVPVHEDDQVQELREDQVQELREDQGQELQEDPVQELQEEKREVNIDEVESIVAYRAANSLQAAVMSKPDVDPTRVRLERRSNSGEAMSDGRTQVYGTPFNAMGRDAGHMEPSVRYKPATHLQSNSSEGSSTPGTDGHMQLSLPESTRVLPSKRVEILLDADGEEQRVGSGAFGNVLKGTVNGSLTVALKELDYNECKLKHILTEEDLRVSFAYEAARASSVNHPFVLPFYGAVIDGPRRFLVSPFCEGGSLEDGLTRSATPIALCDQWRLLTEIASALQYLHSQSMVHKDLKPENILLSSADMGSCHVRLSDFGLAQVDSQVLASTREKVPKEVQMGVKDMMWCSPEEASGHRVTPKSDVFAWGLIAYHIITRQAPWKDWDARDVVRETAAGRVAAHNKLPSTHPLTPLALRCWSSRASDRHSAAELVEELVRLAPACFDSAVEAAQAVRELHATVALYKSSHGQSRCVHSLVTEQRDVSHVPGNSSNASIPPALLQIPDLIHSKDGDRRCVSKSWRRAQQERLAHKLDAQAHLGVNMRHCMNVAEVCEHSVAVERVLQEHASQLARRLLRQRLCEESSTPGLAAEQVVDEFICSWQSWDDISLRRQLMATTASTRHPLSDELRKVLLHPTAVMVEQLRNTALADSRCEVALSPAHFIEGDGRQDGAPLQRQKYVSIFSTAVQKQLLPTSFSSASAIRRLRLGHDVEERCDEEVLHGRSDAWDSLEGEAVPTTSDRAGNHRADRTAYHQRRTGPEPLLSIHGGIDTTEHFGERPHASECMGSYADSGRLRAISAADQERLLTQTQGLGETRRLIAAD